MSLPRRDFLKLAGLSAVMGMGVKAAFELLAPGALDASEVKPAASGLWAQRWGMTLDLKEITPELQKKIVQVCHLAHNVPETSGSQELKWIWSTSFDKTFPELEHPIVPASYNMLPVLALCNHCDNPPCVRVCPTRATFQRGDGVVMMDMHRCMGCRYCMVACPYGSRSFNFGDPRAKLPNPLPNPDYPTRTRGVVEKCTFCTERLAAGLLPACVEASEGNILFGDMLDASSAPRRALANRYSLRRNPSLGTEPQVYYLV